MKTSSVLRLLAAILLLAASGVSAQAPVRTDSTDLGGTAWRLVQFRGSDDKILTPADPAKYTLEFRSDGRVAARVDCNRGAGSWKSAGPGGLELGPLALTRGMCPPASLSDRVAKDWSFVRSYLVRDGHLFLSLMADGGIYEFEPMSPKKTVSGRVKGTATYRERMALPADAVFEATLEDISQADAPAKVIGRVRKDRPGNPPIAFEITYDPSRLDPAHRYVVRARILVAEKPFFTTDQQYPVLTGGRGHEVAVLLRRASAPGPAIDVTGVPDSPPGSADAAGASLEGTNWRLIQLGDAPVTAHSPQQEAHLILDRKSRRVGGSGGCNQLTGSYELSGEQLTFSAMAGTMMACFDGMETEKAFLGALVQAKRWRIAGQRLELFDTAGKMLARFEARPAPGSAAAR